MPSSRSSAFSIFALVTLAPIVSGGMALMSGMAFALLFGNPFLAQTKKWTPILLQVSIVGLGAGMDLRSVATAGLNGFLYTLIGIVFTMGLGWCLGRFLHTPRALSVLLSAGTAICGGSAIAAVSPVIGAKDEETSIALATVFFLNAVALFLFPWVGHRAGLTESHFGLWAALAIHDTSSVVGASMQYGHQALEIATTVKLTRALWIVPLVLLIGFKQDREIRTKKPWFILGFLGMAAIVTWLPELESGAQLIAHFSRRLLVLTLFFVGSGLTRATLKAVGFVPLLQGVILWLIVAGVSFYSITQGWISS